jgi:hypothetical protein
MIVNLAMGAKDFEGVGFVDAKSPATVESQIDRISAYQLSTAPSLRLWVSSVSVWHPAPKLT